MLETNPKLPKRHFLHWNRSLCESAAKWCWRQLDCEFPDFSSWYILVPTAESARKLRRALTEFMPTKHSGFLSPQILTPAQYFQLATNAAPIISRAEKELAWIEVLIKASPAIRRNLFNRSPKSEGDSRQWARSCAQDLISLRALLAEADADFAAVYKHAEEEKNRWQMLQELEGNYHQVIAGLNKQDPDDAWRKIAANPPADRSAARWVLAAIPDPIPLIIKAICNHPNIDVLVGAPETFASHFDDWGIPRADIWSRSPIPDDLFEGNRVMTRDATESIQALHQSLQSFPNPLRNATIGCADSSLEDKIVAHCEQNGYRVHQPKGASVQWSEWPALIKLWRDWHLDDSVGQLSQLLAFPAILRSYFSDHPHPDQHLRPNWDRFIQNFIPSTLRQALATTDEKNNFLLHTIRHLDEDRKSLRAGRDFARDFRQWLGKLLANRSLHRKNDLLDLTAIQTMQTWLREWESSPLTEDASSEEALSDLEATLRRAVCYPPKPEPSMDLSGWLELLWDDNPYLVFVHLNEGKVPESHAGDAYLPDTLRSRMGLTDNQNRFSRDAYILRFILEQRRAQGQTTWIVGKQDNDGNGLKPSRLLFLCEDTILPKRVTESVVNATQPQRMPPRSRLWKLNPGLLTLKEKNTISVTEFRQYLACPFRYFLRYHLKMEAIEDPKGELDPRAFGNITHDVLYEIQSTPEYRILSSCAELQNLVILLLDKVMHRKYGKNLSLPLMLQREILIGRLNAACDSIAKARRSGWHADSAEWKFHIDHPEIQVGGWELLGVIDLIEKQESSNRYRITDYKTSEKSISPDKAHLQKLTARNSNIDDIPEYAICSYKSASHRWKDLQLPLYHWVVRQTLGCDADIGYFQLPKALNETGRQSWEDFDAGLEKSALQCAEGIVDEIRAGIFWPPGKASGKGGLEDWLDPDFSEWLDPDWIKQATRNQA